MKSLGWLLQRFVLAVALAVAAGSPG